MNRRARLLCPSWLVVLPILLAPSGALAQSSGPVFPPSIIMTNYDRVLVGQEEALEAGAYAARVGDTTSGWYNPAGMALLKTTAVGASATGYETDLLALQGIGSQRAGGMSLYQLPSFFGAVLAEDVLHSERWRIGLTVTKPISWQQEIVSGPSGGNRNSYSSHVSLSTFVPMFSASYAPLPSLRFGAGIGVALTSLSEIQTLSDQVLTPTTANAFLRTLDGSGSVWNLTGTLGLQWEITRHLVLGAVVRLPGLRIIQSASLIYQNMDNSALPWSETFFSDQSATFNYRLPLEVNLGLAWRSKSFEVEVDVRYHSAISTYTMFASDKTVLVTSTDSGGFPVVTPQTFAGLTNGARAVWNVAVGGHYSFNETWSVNGGFFSDGSPTNAGGENLFRSVDMYGVTAGAKVRGGHFSGSFGLGYSWGRSAPFTFGDPTTGTSVTTKLTVTSLSLLYAVSYKF